jgi:hypothetical protein
MGDIIGVIARLERIELVSAEDFGIHYQVEVKLTGQVEFVLLMKVCNGTH